MKKRTILLSILSMIALVLFITALIVPDRNKDEDETQKNQSGNQSAEKPDKNDQDENEKPAVNSADSGDSSDNEDQQEINITEYSTGVIFETAEDFFDDPVSEEQSQSDESNPVSTEAAEQPDNTPVNESDSDSYVEQENQNSEENSSGGSLETADDPF